MSDKVKVSITAGEDTYAGDMYLDSGEFSRLREVMLDLDRVVPEDYCEPEDCRWKIHPGHDCSYDLCESEVLTEVLTVLSDEELLRPLRKAGYCEKCATDPHHEVCSLTHGCPCCQDTMAQMIESANSHH